MKKPYITIPEIAIFILIFLENFEMINKARKKNINILIIKIEKAQKMTKTKKKMMRICTFKTM